MDADAPPLERAISELALLASGAILSQNARVTRPARRQAAGLNGTAVNSPLSRRALPVQDPF